MSEHPTYGTWLEGESDMSRARTVMMSRVKNEERWIARCLERTWPVAQTVVLWDDGSTDQTIGCAYEALKREAVVSKESMTTGWGFVAHAQAPEGLRSLHIVQSPFAYSVRQKERVNEIRDKNALWAYVKAAVDFDHVLCLDGDEMLSRQAIREWPRAIELLEGGHDILTMPVIYLWDSEDAQRADGVYGDGTDGTKLLRFPRLFTILRLDEQALFDTHFKWSGSAGGFHCGSIPRESFQRRKDGREITGGVFRAPIVHFGYIDDPLRQKKYQFYAHEIDPGNVGEGGYLHIIGKPNNLAPGPVQLVAWEDA